MAIKLYKIATLFMCILTFLQLSCNKNDLDDTDNSNKVVLKKIPNKETLKQLLGEFTAGFEETSSDPLFYIGQDYPDDIEKISYNIVYKRNVAGFEYSRNVLARTGSSYEAMVELEQSGAYKDYIPVEDDRLKDTQYQNIRVIKSNANSNTFQNYAVFIDLKEPFNNKQLAVVSTSRSGFNGEENNALPIIDDRAGVTLILSLLQPL